MGLLTDIDQSNLKIENGKEDFFYQLLRLENENSDTPKQGVTPSVGGN